MSIPDQSKIQKFEDQKQKHQQLVSQLDNKDQEKQVEKPEKKKSQITMKVGEEEPVWANEMPPECGETYYCGLAFTGLALFAPGTMSGNCSIRIIIL